MTPSAGSPVIFGTDVVSILLGGLSAGMVLFIVSVGLSVTMGLMGFVNLAHGAFAMLGGYVIVLAMNRLGLGFFSALALGFVVTAAVSVGARASALSRGSTGRPSSTRCCSPSAWSSSSSPSITLIIGPENQPLTLPRGLQGQIDLGFIKYRTYSIFLIVVGVVDRARAVARLRAHAHRRPDPRHRRQPAHGGIDRHQCRSAVHHHLRVRQRHGGARRRARRRVPRPRSAIRAQVPGLFPDRGRGRRARQVTGVFYASLIIGVLDFALKLYLPKGGTLFIFALTILLLLWRPQGLFGRQPMTAVTQAPAPAAAHPAALALIERHRLRIWEPLPWLIAIAVLFRVPELSRLRHRAAGGDPVRALARSRARLCGHHHVRPRRLLRRRRLYGRDAVAITASGPSRSPACSRARWWRRSSGSPPAWCCCAPPASRC